MLETIHAFFLLPVVLVSLAVLTSIIFIHAVETDNSYGFPIFISVLLSFIYYKYIVMFFANWQFGLLCVGIYGLIGGVWSAFRWFKFCKQLIKENPYDPQKHTEYNASMKSSIPRPVEKYLRELINPSNYKSRLIGWVVFWPWNMFWNVLGDFFTWIYDLFSNSYIRIGEFVIKQTLHPKDYNSLANNIEYTKSIEKE